MIRSPRTTSTNSGSSSKGKKHTKCILLDCYNSGKTVAEGRVCSTDPATLLHFKPIGPKASKVFLGYRRSGLCYMLHFLHSWCLVLRFMKTNREEIYVERSFKPNNSTIQNLMDIERFILPHTSTSGVARLKMRVISWVGLQFYNY
ncbi:unnamed protein product [Arabidopsis thaliana]|uniref:(thale cress) hypothetical protein n=1 Tax=Arabidopsis thaliana TaxID=3702 RepID=A0A7G2EUG2_ARATH|nr:unnamed protein product [Arabidopsis thaliana]